MDRLQSGIHRVTFNPGGEPHRPTRRQHTPAVEVIYDDDPVVVAPGLFEPLFGVTGNINGHGIVGDESVPVLKFQLAPLNDLRKLAPDVLPGKELFLLSIGCIRLQTDGYYSLIASGMAADNESLDDLDDQRIKSDRVP